MKEDNKKLLIENNRFLGESTTCKTDNLAIKAKLSSQDLQVFNLNQKIKSLKEELLKKNEAKNIHKIDNYDLNEKILSLEEELYE